MQTHILKLLCGASLALQGCSNTLYGPARPFQAGKMGGIVSCAADRESTNDFLRDRFIEAGCASAADPTNDALARRMLETSFSLTNASCNDYFAQKAGTQTGVNIARSVVAPAVTLLTGILSIVSFKNDPLGKKRSDWETGISLASAATLAGLTIWEENFLFSAENIDDVRVLTHHAMAEFRTATLALSNHTFDTNVDYVLQYHMICTPGMIKTLVKQAIKDKKVTVVNRATAAPVAPAGAPLVAPAAAAAGASLDIR